MNEKEELERIQKVYSTTYRHDSEDWGYIWNPRNRVSYVLRHQREQVVIESLNQLRIHLPNARILDLGCGDGDLMEFLSNLGARETNMTGVDLMPDRITAAKRRVPSSRLIVQDISTFLEQDSSHDLIALFTVFSSIHNVSLQQTIAQHVESMLKPGGYVLWFDLLHSNPDPERAQGLTLATVRTLFPNLDVVRQKKLFSTYALPFIVRGHRALAEALEAIPFLPKSSLFAVLKKRTG